MIGVTRNVLKAIRTDRLVVVVTKIPIFRLKWINRAKKSTKWTKREIEKGKIASFVLDFVLNLEMNNQCRIISRHFRSIVH